MKPIKLPKIKLDQQVSDFVARNIMWCVMVIILAMFYIHNGFAYEKLMQEVSDARYELREKEYKFTVVQKKLNGIGVRSNVKARLEASGSGLKDPERPCTRIDD